MLIDGSPIELKALQQSRIDKFLRTCAIDGRGTDIVGSRLAGASDQSAHRHRSDRARWNTCFNQELSLTRSACSPRDLQIFLEPLLRRRRRHSAVSSDIGSRHGRPETRRMTRPNGCPTCRTYTAVRPAHSTTFYRAVESGGRKSLNSVRDYVAQTAMIAVSRRRPPGRVPRPGSSANFRGRTCRLRNPQVCFTRIDRVTDQRAASSLFRRFVRCPSAICRRISATRSIRISPPPATG